MTPFGRFQASIEGALHLFEMYTELRTSRGLGRRGKLDADNDSLLWLPRSSVVMSMSALDAYIHAVIIDRIPSLLKTNTAPDPLLKMLAGMLPVKDGNGFKEVLKYINLSDPVALLTEKIKEQLSFVSYQAPDKIMLGFEMVGVSNVFTSVSDIWQGRNSTEADIKRILANYYKRRNQIAHEGDVDLNNASRAITPKYARGCHDFIEGLVTRMNRVAYP